MVVYDLTIFSDLWHSVSVFSFSRRKGSAGGVTGPGSGSCDPLTSWGDLQSLSLSLCLVWGNLPSRPVSLPCTLAPISHTQGRVGWGRGSGHQPGVGGTQVAVAVGPRAAQGDWF